jgi:hypothetical protein
METLIQSTKLRKLRIGKHIKMEVSQEDKQAQEDFMPERGSKYDPLFGKVALIDSDIIVWRSAAIAEPSRYLVVNSEGNTSTLAQLDDAKSAKELAGTTGIIWSRKEDKGLEFALAVTHKTIESMLEASKPKEARFYLSGKDNFRMKVAKTVPYKGSRELVAKPKYYRELRRVLCEEYGATITTGYEADDAIGMAMGELNDDCFVCTIDKDMDQLAGWHYDWVKDRVYRVSQEDADLNLYAQVLSGDSTDDVPGLPGIGPIKARKILDGATDSSDLLRRTWDKYRSSGVGSDAEKWDYFVEQLRLVYILRHPDDLTSVDMSYEAVFGGLCKDIQKAESFVPMQSEKLQENSPNSESGGNSSSISSPTQAQSEGAAALNAEVQ